MSKVGISDVDYEGRVGETWEDGEEIDEGERVCEIEGDSLGRMLGEKRTSICIRRDVDDLSFASGGLLFLKPLVNDNRGYEGSDPGAELLDDGHLSINKIQR